jgi:hypothetical protein
VARRVGSRTVVTCQGLVSCRGCRDDIRGAGCELFNQLTISQQVFPYPHPQGCTAPLVMDAVVEYSYVRPFVKTSSCRWMLNSGAKADGYLSFER